MKTLAGFFIALSLLLALPSATVWAQAKSFEGTVIWTMTMPEMDTDSHTVTSNFKDGKVEQEVDLGMQGIVKTYAIQEKNAKKYYLVREAMKMGMMAEVPDSSLTKEASAGGPQLSPTGKKAIIAGHPAEEYSIKNSDENLSIWATSDFPKNLCACMANALRAQPRQDNATSNAFLQLGKRGLTPVKIVATGQASMSMEFVKYEQKHLDDALFVPPADIKYQPMPMR